MIRRYLARRKMRWAVRWLRGNIKRGYGTRVIRLGRKLYPVWTGSGVLDNHPPLA